MKFFVSLAGERHDYHDKFIKKLTKRGAKEVKEVEASDAQILFCTIVSRFEADVEWVLSEASGKHQQLHKYIFVFFLYLVEIIICVFCLHQRYKVGETDSGSIASHFWWKLPSTKIPIRELQECQTYGGLPVFWEKGTFEMPLQ